MYSVINSKVKQILLTLAFLKLSKIKTKMTSRNNYNYLRWLISDTENWESGGKELNRRVICNLVQGFGNFHGKNEGPSLNKATGQRVCWMPKAKTLTFFHKSIILTLFLYITLQPKLLTETLKIAKEIKKYMLGPVLIRGQRCI